jgi:hypothetical protein
MVAGASGVVPPAADGAGEPGGNKVLAWQASSLEASSMLRMCRASGNSVRTEMRGWADDGGVSGRSRSVAARRTSRRRPSGKATAMKAGPRPQVNDSSLSTCPNKGCRGSVTVTLETTRSKLPPRCLEWVACVSLPCPGSQRHPLQGCFFVRLKRAVSSSRPDDAQGGARRRGQGWPLGHRALGAALGVLDGGEHGARLGQDGRLGMDDHA